MSRQNDASITPTQDASGCEIVDARENPKPADRYHMTIIGAGTAGLAVAKMAAALGARVALIERHPFSGSRLNGGIVLPSKALIRTSRLYAEMRNAKQYGAQIPGDIRVDFAVVMDRVRRIGARQGSGDSVQKLAEAGVDMFFGETLFTGTETLTVDGVELRFRKALIATGARPNSFVFPGLAEVGYLTNENVFDLIDLPRRLLVIGGGPLGCELAQAFCRLGALTTIVEERPLFLGGEERDAAQILSDAFARDGIKVRLNTRAVAARAENGQKLVDLVSDDYRNTIAVDAILTGIGRTPNVEGLNLEAAGIDYDSEIGIRVDDFLRTSNPNIYAAGDVCLKDKYTQTAIAAARIVVQNALLRRHESLSALIIPSCTFTDPEIAHVGLQVREANLQNIPVKTFTIPMHEIDRALADSEDRGFVKIHVREGTDRILGAPLLPATRAT
jgi:pyruvate/2-oxoglutarate dehydrogenase complex dihydrolipoamide dehydrogenase (E3) component